MGDRLKFIVTELNKGPFKKSYNLISFDSLPPEDLLQVLTDVLAEIDQTNKLDIRTEEPEQTTIRLLNMLRILKYTPGSDPVSFRQGLVQGDKQIIHPILEWLFHNMSELKKRAYLAQYLVKLEIPLEILADPEISSLYEQYEATIEEFKALHKESVALKIQGQSTSELRTDIEAMEKEKEIVFKRIERLARKLDNVENKNELLEAARKLRAERERQKEQSQQRQDELNLLQELQTKSARLSQELKVIRDTAHATTPQDLMKRLEEEVQMTLYLCEEKFPREIDARRREVEILSKVAISPPPTQNDIDALHSRIQTITEEVNNLVQDNLTRSEVSDDRVAPFRQQASIMSRRKEEMAESFSQARQELDSLLFKLKEKEAEEGKTGEGTVSEDAYRELVSRIKVRGAVYKFKRSQISALVAETGVLARTIDILKTRLANRTQTQAAIGVPNLSKEGLLHSLSDLNTNISAQKTKLAPQLQGLRKLREQYNEMLEDYNEKKRIYDTTAANLGSVTAKVEQEVKELKKEKQSAGAEIALLKAKATITETLLQRAQDEFIKNSQKSSSPSIRDKLLTKIAEEEKLSKELKEKQKEAKESQDKNAKQRDLWVNLKVLLDSKQECLEKQKHRDGVLTRDRGAETLILE